MSIEFGNTSIEFNEGAPSSTQRIADAVKNVFGLSVSSIIINNHKSSTHKTIYLKLSDNSQIAVGTVKASPISRRLIIEQGRGVEITHPINKNKISGLKDEIYCMIIDAIITEAKINGYSEVLFVCKRGNCPIINPSKNAKMELGATLKGMVSKTSAIKGTGIIFHICNSDGLQKAA